MLTQDWLTDSVLYLYALSLLFFVSDAASGNRNARMAGTGLLVFVWILQTGFLLYLLFQRYSMAELSLRDFLFFVSWLLISISFVVNRWIRAELLVLLVNTIGFAVLAINLLQRPRNFVMTTWETAKKLLVVHISFITVAFALLTLSAILAIMYLLLHHDLKKKRWKPFIKRMPGLEVIDRHAFRSGLVGVPMLFLSLSTGTAVLLMDSHAAHLLDVKVILSFAAGILYVIYLIRRTMSAGDGKRSARWNLLGYAVLLAAFFANSLTTFRLWK
jgi:HemX protein